jgi:hypothetical protein
MTKESTPDATISSDLEKRLLSNLLDISGESQYQDLYERITQALAYMQQHRCIQPHRRYVLGLNLNKDTVVLIRADGIGVEYCTIDKMSAHGAQDVIQLTLGLMVVDDDPMMRYTPITKTLHMHAGQSVSRHGRAVGISYYSAMFKTASFATRNAG